ncbi:DUF4349 domain-containing protein [Paenibacillus sp. GM2]|uniref:DUF4349 domain-containing protein n=1 Tax=Paenibacillus sp. GM2 TaxID=1622070 RepID=UPI000837EB57|nr:DUF4349 domain-containing protein [Paenibacillus sp. GM2]
MRNIPYSTSVKIDKVGLHEADRELAGPNYIKEHGGMMMSKWRNWKTAVLLVLTLLLSGCGSAGVSHNESKTGSDADFAAADKATGMDAAATESVSKHQSGDPQFAPDGSGNPGSSGFQGADMRAGMNKKLIYTANVVMQVDDYSKAQSEIRNQVALAGGYIVDFSENRSLEEQGGTITIKVPSTGFSSFLEQLEKLEHTSLQRSIQGQDVSEEYVDLESRLKVKEAMEARYLKFIDEATKTSQLVEYVNALERIQTEIEQIKGRMRYLDSNVSFSTVEIRLYQPDVKALQNAGQERSPLLERAGKSLQGSIQVVSALFEWLVVILAGAIPVIVIAGIIFAIVWLLQRAIRTRARRHRNYEYQAIPASEEKQAHHPEAAESLTESQPSSAAEKNDSVTQIAEPDADKESK